MYQASQNTIILFWLKVRKNSILFHLQQMWKFSTKHIYLY